MLATALLLAVLPGCSEDKESPPPIGPSSTPTSAHTSTVHPTEAEHASRAVDAKIREFYAVLSRLRQDTRQDLGRLESVAISTELTAQRQFVRQEHRKGRRQVGETKIANLAIQSVNLDSSDPKSGKVPAVLVDVCWDVSDVDVVDKEGNSVVSPDRPDTGWTRHIVANFNWSEDPEGGWRVASGEDLKKMPCSPVS
ncbi:hypothetical protein [Aeromicrobium sp. PE09-221]|uniref:hypothetical protein n=1 Tax=Aeromicrobium sp. PE09-221 TaxID=1898043 RepID=UPI001F363D28|nr:hypothetical protein [Aeromicrobium sp. PE09-221]